MEDYTDRYAKYYNLLTSHKDYVGEVRLLADFVRAQGFKSDARLLSVGCGTGSHERLLGTQFGEIVGIDSSEGMIRYGSERNGVKNLTLKSVSLAELVEREFDVVISLFNVLNCIDGTEALKVFFSEIAAKTKENGIVVLEVWNPIAIVHVPPQMVEREYNEGKVRLARTAKPYLYPQEGVLRLEYDITGQDGDETVFFRSIHNISLHSRELLEYCLREAGFGPADWYSALSEGMKPAINDDRMLLFCARKIVS